jgi:hypothetical protein
MVPGGRVTETFANVIAPLPGIGQAVAILYPRLSHGCRFAQLSSCPVDPFLTQQLRELTSALVPKAHPHEMKKFMDNNQTQCAGLLHKLRIDHHFTLSQEAGCVHRNAPLSLITEQLAAMRSQL